MVMSYTSSSPDGLPPVQMNNLKRAHAPLQAELKAAAARVIDSGWTILGPEVEAFEQAWASQAGAAFCVGVASGSDALQLALRALDIGPGDAVLTVANAGGYATQAILAIGARPLFVDIDGDSLLVDLDALRAALSPGVRALVVTHLYGRMAAMPDILALCRAAGVPVIEDAAQAHGAAWEGRPAGGWGDLSCFSFYPTKNLGALGDGGAVCCSDPALATRLRQLRQYGWQPKYHVQLPGGMNSRLDEMQAAFLRVLLPSLEAANTARRQVADRYLAVLDSLPGGTRPVRPAAALDVAHLFVLRHPERDGLRARLLARGIQSDVHYPCADHLQPGFALRVAQLGQAPLPPAGALPHTESACAGILSLPCHPWLEAGEVARVSDALREAWQ